MSRFGRICNPTALSICIYNAKTMKFFVVVGLQIRLNGQTNGATTKASKTTRLCKFYKIKRLI